MTSPPASPPQPDGFLPNQPRRDPHATSDYILDLSGELSRLAAEAGLELLAYLLDMVRLEADLMVKRTTPPKG